MLFSYLKSLRGKIVVASAALTLLGLLVLATSNVVTARNHALDSLAASTKGLTRSHADGVGEWVASRKLQRRLSLGTKFLWSISSAGQRPYVMSHATRCTR